MCSRDLWERDKNQTSLPPIPNSATPLQAQESQQRYSQDPCTPLTSSGKKSRFRFSEAERIKSINELNLLCEGNFVTQEALWKNLDLVLCYDSDRYVSKVKTKSGIFASGLLTFQIQKLQYEITERSHAGTIS